MHTYIDRNTHIRPLAYLPLRHGMVYCLPRTPPPPRHGMVCLRAFSRWGQLKLEYFNGKVNKVGQRPLIL